MNCFDPERIPAGVWLLFGPGRTRHTSPGLARLVDTFEASFGDRCRVVSSHELLMGVRGGRLVLEDLQRRPVCPPRVVHSRLSTPRLSADRELTLLRQLELMGSVLLNGVDAISAGVNKFWQLQQLAIAGLPVMDTHTYADARLSEVIDAGVPEPCVVKSVRGNNGLQVFLARDAALLRDIHGSLREDSPYLFQEYLEYSHGRDLRVVVVDGRPVAAFESRATDGGMSTYHPAGTYLPEQLLGVHPAAEALSVRAAAALGLDVAGVDLLFCPDGGFVICEVNPNPGLHTSLDSIPAALVAACAARLESAAFTPATQGETRP
ncbi:RimK family alpha-L-glutamate ligase [Nocardia sp. NPDC088792]|uniref:RimK family alpha-L-glutamate ligase n=1 Tax=Nocardia sp. NPDC088792 TaxID=3364332 RepID=UPI00382B9C6E